LKKDLIYEVQSNVLLSHNETNKVKKLTDKTDETNIVLNSCKNSVKKEYSKSIWTFLTDNEAYLNSAIKLIKSIKNHTTRHDFDFLIMEIKEKPISESLKTEIEKAGWKICRVDRIAPRDEANTFGRFRDQFTKLVLWNFTEYDAIYYFDSDTFAIKSLDSYLNIHKNFNSSIKIGVSRDIRAGRWQSSFNMGVFVIKPNHTEFNRLIRLKSDDSVKFETAMSEQGFLNVVYKDQWYEIGFENNANLAAYSQIPDYWKQRQDNISVIHYTMNKPWACSAEYMPICKYWLDFKS
jgi:lipopolysaccharide biosynthesis glycosyltransferase